MQYKEADVILCTSFDVKYFVSESSASPQNVFIIWFYVPAGFTHVDDMKKNIYFYPVFIFDLEASEQVFGAGIGGAMCVQ